MEGDAGSHHAHALVAAQAEGTREWADLVGPLQTIVTGEIECIGTLGSRGSGTIIHRTGGVEREIALDNENPYLRQLRAFVLRCAGGRSRIDAHAITNLELLHRLTS